MRAELFQANPQINIGGPPRLSSVIAQIPFSDKFLNIYDRQTKKQLNAKGGVSKRGRTGQRESVLQVMAEVSPSSRNVFQRGFDAVKNKMI